MIGSCAVPALRMKSTPITLTSEVILRPRSRPMRLLPSVARHSVVCKPIISAQTISLPLPGMKPVRFEHDHLSPSPPGTDRVSYALLRYAHPGADAAGLEN